MPTTVALANMCAEDHTLVEEACNFLDDIGCSALVGVAHTPDSIAYLLAVVHVGDEGHFEINTESEARAGDPLPRQALTLAHQLRQLAPTLIQ